MADFFGCVLMGFVARVGLGERILRPFFRTGGVRGFTRPLRALFGARRTARGRGSSEPGPEGGMTNRQISQRRKSVWNAWPSSVLRVVGRSHRPRFCAATSRQQLRLRQSSARRSGASSQRPCRVGRGAFATRNRCPFPSGCRRCSGGAFCFCCEIKLIALHNPRLNRAE